MIPIAKKIISWYGLNKRDLPWRVTKDPYKIWVSEIILQQTRVEQGLPYYHRFIERFPTVESLATATITEVLLLWQGLGYYSRARNMHETANIIASKFKGSFPEKYSEIITLKGIGKYTAAAISSFAFKQYTPVVDGNVIRVITRLFGITESAKSSKILTQIESILQEEILASKSPDIFNQSIMEFGALVCTPKQPKCYDCVFLKQCKSYQYKIVDLLPNIPKKNIKKERVFNYFVLFAYEHADLITFIQKRTEQDIWRDLYQFPLLEGKITKQSIFDFLNTSRSLMKSIKPIHMPTHQLSHQNIKAVFWIIELKREIKFPNCEKIKVCNISKYPFPVLTTSFINNHLFKD